MFVAVFVRRLREGKTYEDFLEAWYPEDRAFSLRAASLYDPLIRSVRNHPCVASWTACDEESLENYRDLTKHLAPRPALLDREPRYRLRPRPIRRIRSIKLGRASLELPWASCRASIASASRRAPTSTPR